NGRRRQTPPPVSRCLDYRSSGAVVKDEGGAGDGSPLPVRGTGLGTCTETRLLLQPALIGRGSVASFLPGDFCRVGVRLWLEFHDPAVEHFGHVQVAVLVSGQLVRTIELPGLSAPAAPPVQIMPVQVVLEDPVRPAGPHPDI